MHLILPTLQTLPVMLGCPSALVIAAMEQGYLLLKELHAVMSVLAA